MILWNKQVMKYHEHITNKFERKGDTSIILWNVRARNYKDELIVDESYAEKKHALICEQILIDQGYKDVSITAISSN